MKITISTSEKNQGILEKIATLSDALPLSVRSENTQKLDELTADDYRKAAVLNGGRILSKRMKVSPVEITLQK